MLALGHGAPTVAERTGLHVGYVYKLVQRDEGRDPAWAAWRRDNPARVKRFRVKQDQDRLLQRKLKRGQRDTDG